MQVDRVNCPRDYSSSNIDYLISIKCQQKENKLWSKSWEHSSLCLMFKKAIDWVLLSVTVEDCVEGRVWSADHPWLFSCRKTSARGLQGFIYQNCPSLSPFLPCNCVQYMHQNSHVLIHILCGYCMQTQKYTWSIHEVVFRNFIWVEVHPRVNLALLFQEFIMMFLLPKTGITPVKA